MPQGKRAVVCFSAPGPRVTERTEAGAGRLLNTVLGFCGCDAGVFGFPGQGVAFLSGNFVFGVELVLLDTDVFFIACLGATG